MRLKGMEQEMTEEQIKKLVKKMADGKMNKAQTIREMFAAGMDVKEIATSTGIRYNQVYNTIKNEVLKNGLEVETTGRNSEHSKKNLILALLQEGKSITAVAQETRSIYNYVWSIANAAGLTKKSKSEAV